MRVSREKGSRHKFSSRPRRRLEYRGTGIISQGAIDRGSTVPCVPINVPAIKKRLLENSQPYYLSPFVCSLFELNKLFEFPTSPPSPFAAHLHLKQPLISAPSMEVP